MIDHTALHEAGHAVVSHLLNLPVELATCEPSGDFAGKVVYCAVPVLTGAAKDAETRRYLIAALAGRAAVGDGLGATTDHDIAWRYARQLVGDDPDDAPIVGQVLRDAWDECQQLVRSNGQAIRDVARNLQIFGTLDTGLLAQTIAQALASQAYWQERDRGRWAYKPELEGETG